MIGRGLLGRTDGTFCMLAKIANFSLILIGHQSPSHLEFVFIIVRAMLTEHSHSQRVVR